MRTFRRILTEPLVQFLLIGIVLFAAYATLNPKVDAPAIADADEIVVTPQMVAQLADMYEAVWRRPAAPDTLDRLIENYIREEALVREARALSLDVGDSVVRQRLMQKMAFLSDAAAAAKTPTEEQLATFHAENAERYRVTPRLAFEQVFLGKAATEAEINAARDALTAGADPARVGVETVLPASIPPASAAQIDRTFGTGLFDAMAGFDVGAWAGPLTSAYGTHLVRVAERTEARDPPLDEVRDKVLRDWLDAEKARTRLEAVDGLVARYNVRRPSPDELQALTQ